MIKKVRLTSVQRYTQDKNGNPFKTKDGKPYTRMLIKTEEFGDRLLSGFGGQWNDSWKEGDEQTLDITEVQRDGKTYLNFGRVNMQERMMEMITELSQRVSKLEQNQNKGYNYPERTAETTPPDDWAESEEVPDEAFENT